MKSVILSLVTFLLTSALLVATPSAKREQPKTVIEKPSHRFIWKKIPGDPCNFAGPMELNGKRCPSHWQKGWRWNGYIAVEDN